MAQKQKQEKDMEFTLLGIKNNQFIDLEVQKVNYLMK